MADMLTFAEIREYMRETSREIRERTRETERLFQETDRKMQETDRQMKETDRQMKETDRQMKETDRQMKETDRRLAELGIRFGDLGNRFGELAEHLVSPSINAKFNELGFNFEEVSHNKTIKTIDGCFLAEIDILLENGDTVIAVEVKAKPLEKDVDKHIGRMEILRSRADMRNDTRKFQGAIAGAIMLDEVRDYAHKAGFYVIEQTGDTVKINIPEGFTPRVW